MSKLLINEYPLMVLPSLANAVGLNEAIFLQQLHYWITTQGHERDGYMWVYNTFESWQEQFPFWCLRTVKSVVRSLEKQGIIVVGNYNKMRIDRTKWYRINYERLQSLISSP